MAALEPQMAREAEYISPATPQERAAIGWKLVGAATALEITGNNISRACSAEVIRALERIEAEKIYLDMGYERFVDFLNDNHCFIGKSTYYERLALLKKEGTQLYDLMNGLDISLSKRKQIGAGNIEIQGDLVILKESQEKIPLSDRQRLLDVLVLAVDELAVKTKKLAIGEEDFRRERQKRLDLEDNAAAASSRSLTPLDKAHMAATGIVASLVDEIAALDANRCQAYLDGPFQMLAAQFQRVNDAICNKLELESLDELDI